MAEYETVTVGQDETLTVEIQGEEIVENVIYDVSAQGADVLFRATGDGWKFHNIGIRGKMSMASGFMFYVGTDGGEGVIENVYIGDGFETAGSNPIALRGDHVGTLKIRQVYASYSSRGVNAYPGRDGKTIVEDCLFEDMNLAAIKGSGGDEVYNTVVDQRGEVPPTTEPQNARGIWAREGGTMIVEGCDIDVTGPDGTTAFSMDEHTNISATDCRYSGQLVNRPDQLVTSNVTEGADLTPPSGCPLSPEEAATAQRDEPAPEPDPGDGGDDGSGDDGSGGGDDGTNGGDDGTDGGGDDTQPSQSGIPVEYVAAGGAAVAIGYYLTRRN